MWVADLIATSHFGLGEMSLACWGMRDLWTCIGMRDLAFLEEPLFARCKIRIQRWQFLSKAFLQEKKKKKNGATSRLLLLLLAGRNKWQIHDIMLWQKATIVVVCMTRIISVQSLYFQHKPLVYFWLRQPQCCTKQDWNDKTQKESQSLFCLQMTRNPLPLRPPPYSVGIWPKRRTWTLNVCWIQCGWQMMFVVK